MNNKPSFCLLKSTILSLGRFLDSYINYFNITLSTAFDAKFFKAQKAFTGWKAVQSNMESAFFKDFLQQI